MTTSVAFLDHHGVVAIGADTKLSGVISSHLDTKVHQVGPFVVAWSGGSVVNRFLIEQGAGWSLPGSDSPQTPAELRDRLNVWMKERGNGKQDHDGDWFVNGSLIVVGMGDQDRGPFIMHGDGSVGTRAEGYVAIGSGQAVACGVMFAAKKRKWTAAVAVQTALQAAAYHDPFTGGSNIVIVDP